MLFPHSAAAGILSVFLIAGCGTQSAPANSAATVAALTTQLAGVSADATARAITPILAGVVFWVFSSRALFAIAGLLSIGALIACRKLPKPIK